MQDLMMTLTLALGASFLAGINLYATLFTLGALSRFTAFNLPGGLDVLESDWVMWPALAMYLVEFVADKVPAVDTTWDAVQTFLRVPAGVIIAATALGDVPMEFQLLAGMVGGTLAATSHLTKSTTRVAAHVTGTSPILSPVLSVVEDVTVVSLLALMVAHPVIAGVILVLMLIGALVILYFMWRVVKFVARGIGRLLGMVRCTAPNTMPQQLMAG